MLGGPIGVSSAHLASAALQLVELSELEFRLSCGRKCPFLIAGCARWLWNAAGLCMDLSQLENVLVLHSVNHRDRAQKSADILLGRQCRKTDHTGHLLLKKTALNNGVVTSKQASRAIRQPLYPCD